LIQVTGQQQKVRTWETSKPELTRTHARTHAGPWSRQCCWRVDTENAVLENGKWRNKQTAAARTGRAVLQLDRQSVSCLCLWSRWVCGST